MNYKVKKKNQNKTVVKLPNHLELDSTGKNFIEVDKSWRNAAQNC